VKFVTKVSVKISRAKFSCEQNFTKFFDITAGATTAGRLLRGRVPDRGPVGAARRRRRRRL